MTMSTITIMVLMRKDNKWGGFPPHAVKDQRLALVSGLPQELQHLAQTVSLRLVIGVLVSGVSVVLTDATDEHSPGSVALFGTEQGHERLPELVPLPANLNARVTQFVELHAPLVAFLAGFEVLGEDTGSIGIHVVSFLWLFSVAPHIPEVLREREEGGLQ